MSCPIIALFCTSKGKVYFTTQNWTQIPNIQLSYRNDAMFSEGQVWANYSDPDQMAPEGAVWSGTLLFAIVASSLDA